MKTKNKKFRKAFKAGANLPSSSKLIKYIVEAKKKKWEIIHKPLEIYSLNQRADFKDPGSLDFQSCSESFKKAWKTKQNFQEHFLLQRQSHYKRFAAVAKKSISNPSNPNFQQEPGTNLPRPKLRFLLLWESRLDVLLWKSKLVSSLAQARQFIFQGYVAVKSKTESDFKKRRKPSKLLETGDFVTLILPKPISKNLLQNFKEPKLGLVPPFYIEAHYTSFSFLLVQRPAASQLCYNFNFNLKDLQI